MVYNAPKNFTLAVIQIIDKPVSRSIKRSKARYQAARLFYSGNRYLGWLIIGRHFAKKIEPEALDHVHFQHETVLLRQLKDVDMKWQHNKIENLKIAATKLNGVLVHPGQTFSYWRLIGKPTYKKGYLDGVFLSNGQVSYGCGGGLCQLSNLIYWMTLHTELTITERHRHGYDVFPDSNRTQPFGSGATCFYPYGDLMIKNNTQQVFQLCVHVGETFLEGEWRSDENVRYRYEVFEKNHHFNGEYWGGFSRHNELYRRVYDLDGTFVDEEYITENHALTMYTPLIEAAGVEDYPH